MGFRDSEKRRLEPLKKDLFTDAACEPGLYRGRRRPFCLHEHHSHENLHESIREDALRYFADRGIRWHDGIDGAPSNHLCCSQSCCVNFWFPFVAGASRTCRCRAPGDRLRRGRGPSHSRRTNYWRTANHPSRRVRVDRHQELPWGAHTREASRVRPRAHEWRRVHQPGLRDPIPSAATGGSRSWRASGSTPKEYTEQVQATGPARPTASSRSTVRTWNIRIVRS